MRISIITLNFNGSEDTIKLLGSLEEQTDKDFEVIVVDNASEETDYRNLQTFTDTLNLKTRIIKNNRNLGFSGGNNVGIRQALENGSDWVVWLNNDTWVESTFIERLKSILSAKNGVVGIPLIEGDRVAYCGKVQWLKPTLQHIYAKYNTQKNKCYIIGGAAAIQKDIFQKVGLLDEKYFLYFEDADFSIRAKKAGLKISVADSLSVHHHTSSTTKKLGSPLLLRYHYRNALYFNSKNSPWYIKLLIWPWSLIIIAKQLIKLIMRKNIAQSRSILSGVIDFYRNSKGKIK